MQTELIIVSAFFSFASALGFYLAYLYNRKSRKFKLSAYFMALALPLLFSFSLTALFGIKILIYFVASAAVGTFLEWFVGMCMKNILHKNIWVYEHSSIGGHTSYLSVLIWGVAGIVFFLISKIIGL